MFTDDFSSDEDDADDDDDENIKGPRCKALYQYSAKLNDELSLEPGKSNTNKNFPPMWSLYLCVHVCRLINAVDLYY